LVQNNLCRIVSPEDCKKCIFFYGILFKDFTLIRNPYYLHYDDRKRLDSYIYNPSCSSYLLDLDDTWSGKFEKIKFEIGRTPLEARSYYSGLYSPLDFQKYLDILREDVDEEIFMSVDDKDIELEDFSEDEEIYDSYDK